MDDYIAIILIPVYILLGLLGRRLLTYAHGYEKRIRRRGKNKEDQGKGRK